MGALSDLVANVRTFTNREDLTTVEITSFIRMAEARFNRELRIEEMIVSQDITLDMSVGYIDMTVYNVVDYWQISFVKDANSDNDYIAQGRPIKPATLDQLAEANRGSWRRGAPYFAVLRNRLRFSFGTGFEAFPDTVALHAEAYARVIPITDDVSNDVYVNFPDMYLYATLLHTAPRLQEDDRVQVWGGASSDTIAAANAAWERKKMSGGPIRTRRRGFG